MISKTLLPNFNKSADVVACYIESDGEILLLHPHAHKSNGDRWGLPAGKIDPEESMYRAMNREILEETGLNIPEEKLKYLDSLYVRHEGRDFEYHMFSTQLSHRPEIRLSPSEHKDYKWMFPEEALKMNLIYDLNECIRLSYKL